MSTLDVKSRKKRFGNRRAFDLPAAEIDVQKSEGWWHDQTQRPSVILKYRDAKEFLEPGPFAEEFSNWIETNVGIAIGIAKTAHERLNAG